MRTHYQKESARALALGLMLVGAAVILISSFCYLQLARTANADQMREAMLAHGAIVALFTLLILLIFALCENHNKKLARMAFVDAVTGGHTRARFEMEAREKVRNAPPCTYAMISMNIEKFKLVNHTFGVEAADTMLKNIHDAISQCLDDDELLCRDYADGFTLLVKFTTKEKMLNEVAMFARKVNEPAHELESRYRLRVSLGVYCIDDPFISIVDMQDRAAFARKSDKAAIAEDLFRCVFYSDIDQLRMVKLKDIENKMYDALINEDFIVHLQPKVALKNSAIAGAEALVRWKDGDNGLIPPGDFIPFFESNGFITKLDLYVFEKVCALIRKWLDNGLRPVPISVNLSRAHLTDQDCVGKYVAIREKYAVPPELLELELTESLDQDNMGALPNFVNRLREHGFRCSLDDFGRGYSSLNTLKDINVDTLKLDSAFWASPKADNKKERDIIQSLVELARKLNITIVSEGVETLAQVAFLREINCDLVQGYVFFKPVPPEKFEELAFGDAMRVVEEAA